MSMRNGEAVGLISGGLDSTVVAAVMDANYDASHFLFADYGQKTLDRELRAFDELVDVMNPETATVIDLNWMRKVGGAASALFDPGVKLTEENKKLEYVPFRNANLLSAGVALAESVGAVAVLIGSTGSDRTCPDNSPQFVAAMQQLVAAGTMSDEVIKIVAPLIELDKEGVISLGVELDAPMAVSWSCHNNTGDIACAACTNCVARKAAFDSLGLVDPVQYDV